MSALKQLGEMTYTLEHNPKCERKYVIRLVGPGAERLDGEHDIIGFGQTMEEAAKNALDRKEAMTAPQPSSTYSGRPRLVESS